MIKNAIILAAGRGSRMKLNIPKCAVEVLKKPMIMYLYDVLIKCHIENIVAVVGYQKEIIQDILGENIDYAFQDEQLGTAHACLKAKEILSNKEGITLILSGDVPLISENTINDLINEHLRNKNDLTFITTKLEDPTGYGRVAKKNNKYTIIEEKEANYVQKTIKEVNAGIYCINNTILFPALEKIKPNNQSNEYYLTDLIDILNENYQVSKLLYLNHLELIGINDLASLEEAERKLQKYINNNFLLNGVKLMNKDSIYIGPDVKIASNVIIYPNTMIYGKTTIQENTIIGPNTIIYNANIGKSNHIISSMIYDSIIGDNNQVGPFAHIKANTILNNENRIGNFVELKNSSIQDYCHVAHHAYLGDVRMGKNINIGCGVISANFDGKDKHQTKIMDNAFIGCNVNLIAPVTIGENSLIAAGTTITDDVEKDTFVVGRVAQINKKNHLKKE